MTDGNSAQQESNDGHPQGVLGTPDEDLEGLAPPDVQTYLQMRDEDFERYLERVRRHRDALLRKVLGRKS